MENLKNLKIGKFKMVKTGTLKGVKSGNIGKKRLGKNKFKKSQNLMSLRALKSDALRTKKKIEVRELPVKITWLIGVSNGQLTLIDSDKNFKSS
jgi:ferredoxin-fold anticodon binding domain-containing protein